MSTKITMTTPDGIPVTFECDSEHVTEVISRLSSPVEDPHMKPSAPKGKGKAKWKGKGKESGGGSASVGKEPYVRGKSVVITKGYEDTAKRLQAFIKKTTTGTLSVVDFALFYNEEGGERDQKTIGELKIRTFCEQFPDLLEFIKGSKPSLTFVKAL